MELRQRKKGEIYDQDSIEDPKIHQGTAYKVLYRTTFGFNLFLLFLESGREFNRI